MTRNCPSSQQLSDWTFLHSLLLLKINNASAPCLFTNSIPTLDDDIKTNVKISNYWTLLSLDCSIRLIKMFFFLGRFLLSSVVSRGQFYKYWLCYLFTQIRSEQVLHRSMGSRANTQLDRSIHVMLEISSAAQLPLHTDAGKRASSFRAAAHHSLSKLPSSGPQNTRQPLKTSSSDCQNTAFAAFGKFWSRLRVRAMGFRKSDARGSFQSVRIPNRTSCSNLPLNKPVLKQPTRWGWVCPLIYTALLCFYNQSKPLTAFYSNRSEKHSLGQDKNTGVFCRVTSLSPVLFVSFPFLHLICAQLPTLSASMFFLSTCLFTSNTSKVHWSWLLPSRYRL